MSDVERVLVLRQFAALARKGDDAVTALERLLPTLPSGEVRDDVQVALRALASGAPVGPGDFARVLASRSGPEQAEALAEALELRLEARDAVAAGRGLVQLGVVVPLVTLSVVGWLDLHGLTGGAELPLPTLALVTVSAVLKWLGLPLALAAVLVIGRVGWSFMPGAHDFARAQRLLELSTYVDPGPGLGALGLLPAEASVVRALGTPTQARGLVALAGELRRDARASVAGFRLLAPVIFSVVAFLFFAVVLAALYLPVFSMAGSIK